MNQNLSNLGKQEKTMRKTELKLCSDYSSTELCGKGSKGNLEKCRLALHVQPKKKFQVQNHDANVNMSTVTL